ncbi:ATPase AAA [Xenorhabdus cabanillasii]|uniref:Adenylate kinase family enzyme n=2 Tax=Xenorhabdus cabanillasii TaxID=351673 RepID=A0A3D9UEU9_9GAMM|nr:ATPase AAA [Xenorhabdus cabanillasii]PHM76178.1 ATPase AAA [Xenorhabdus cabanillasii JM26]REF26893.1 hypothetical protein BDD26_1590 [Xenorhabdus cabanillasii]CDL80112.1 DNA topology modulation protein flar-related protein [Xenorhabdus cabanillasii JM26]
MQLSDLGNRICIMGPSNSGKSTLANAISTKCNLKTIHLDQLFHLPNTNWQERTVEEFISLPSSLLRYVNRTLFQNNRYGALEGGKDSIKWKMLHHITVITPKSRERYAAMFEQLTIPKIRLNSIKEIKEQFDKWELTR